MDKAQLCERLKTVLVKVLLLERGKSIAEGTGVVVDPCGLTLTAAHVLKKYKVDGSQVIVGIPVLKGSPLRFRGLFGGLKFHFGVDQFLKPVTVDLAILLPFQRLINQQYIEMAGHIPSEGTDVVMAGFSEEVKLPLNIADSFRFDHPDVARREVDIREFMLSRMPLILFKSGMIGGVYHIVAETVTAEVEGSKVTFRLHAAEYWIDNTFTKGASGGPVVDIDGRLIGIIVETGETHVSDLSGELIFPVPSGTTMAQSHKLITWALEKLKASTS